MTTTRADDWIRRFHPAPGAGGTLVCFPHAGGSAGYFFPLSRALAPEVEVLAVQYPGRQDRRAEAVVEEIPLLAARIAEVLRERAGARLVLFGHSMGAVVAFEVVRLLEGGGVADPSVAGIIASARRAPSLPPGTAVHLRDDAGIMAEIRRLSGTDDAVIGDRELMLSLMPAIRGDYKAIETYRCPPGATVGCPVTAFAGEADPVATPEQVAAWSGHTTGAFSLRTFPGGHFYLNGWNGPVVREIRRCLPTAAVR
ncbi:thioesterase II family protein [Streptomyces sp. NRRL F-5123]|uniref:thioesterase II family protein n=1 Tax=Streptomyces sp. NRRL F-5123 TaxID=1463856 RepID=UPI0004E25651|nr:alpha/beta fold hydrolase [Streptomyces sp. NRRL F-5123]